MKGVISWLNHQPVISVYAWTAILKSWREALYEELGMNLSTAFNIFVRQSLRERGIPFKITEGTPSKETVSAMLEAERIAKDPTVKGYHDVDEFFANLDS